MSLALPIALAALGLVAGLAVNALATSYRRGGVLRLWPHCDGCDRPLAPLALGALVGVPFSRYCCRCGSALWGRAIPAQLVTATAFVAAGMHTTGVTVWLLITLVEISLLLAVLFIDLATRLIPTGLIALLVLLALGHAALGADPRLGAALLGGLVGGGSFAILVALAHLRYGPGALGVGDATLALAIGCVTGYPLVVPTLTVGIVMGGVAALTIVATSLLRRRSDAGLRITVPYAPYLALAGILAAMHIIAIP